MQTSATGPSIASLPGAHGFTLLEVMLVVAIVGIVSAVAILALPDRAEDDLELAAAKLLGAIEDCRHSAVLTGVPAGIELSVEGYHDSEYRGQWRPSKRVAAHRFADGVESTFDATAADGPAVVCLPTGETRLPPLTLVHRASGAVIDLVSDDAGDIVAVFPEPAT